ncbi:DNA polymerase III subunit chi [Psychromonas sp. psych-6C06]|uniref:DNA polymerase III subunit chi n=1 Tax=Psychromonas sp. psych-6C06 TaxID=2058089 RepID=UPI000C31F061|nr:DNA polymerase III subunit chi [Psychromonas sp. psych-6C06]PKF63015.1 DNA polymerase III subunit chi [Psychromonas sp. psych-6C06]
MSQVTFYILNETSNEPVPAQISQACSLAAFYYQQNRKVFIYTDNQQDAFMVDEYLWQFDGDSFVPHNLLGEGPKFGTPVEISWMPPTHPRPILINLSLQLPDFSSNFQQIIDFVPHDEQLKTAARLRYSAYKKLGHTLSTETLLSDTTENSNSNNQTEDK